MKKSYLFLSLLVAGICFAACKEGNVKDMYIQVSVHFEPKDTEMEFVEFGPSKITVRDMHDAGQGDITWPCHGDTTITLVKSFYDIKFEGPVTYRYKGRTETAKFISISNFQRVLIEDQTIAISLIKN